MVSFYTYTSNVILKLEHFLHYAWIKIAVLGIESAFYKLLFHSLFKVEFHIDHFVLGEHRER